MVTHLPPIQVEGLGVDPDQAVMMYQRMRLIRRFEETVGELVNANEVPGVTHEYIGQEAVAVGVCSALRSDDVITSTHRGHGHILAKGGDPAKMLAELMGRVAGYNKGRGGSMHIADFSLGIYGANGIVCAGAPMACGAAYASKVAGLDRVAVTFFGDGGINQGVLLESMNMAAIWELPVVFLCENNGYAVTTPISAVSRTSLTERAASFGMEATSVDGMDVAAVYAAALDAVERARSNSAPSFMECRTYRYQGHQSAERVMKLRYRTDDEIQLWMAKDPINAWAKQLASVGVMSPEAREAIDADIDKLLAEGIEFARASAWPEPSSVLEYMYANVHPAIPAKGWE